MARWYRMQSIGVVRRPGSDADPAAFFDPFTESQIVVDSRWESGLERIEDFSHLVVVFFIDRARRRRTAGASMPLEGVEELPPVGFFATRTPRRPNQIGLSYPRLVGRDANVLTVVGLDAWDGTPVLDIKGYYVRDERQDDATAPDWLQLLWDRHDAERKRSGVVS